MKNYLLIILSFLITHSVISQDKEQVETELVSKTEFEISIIQVFPDSFPQVSVLFQAKNQRNEPLWLLNKSDFGIKENGFECEVLDVRNISENTPLNIALVFDHSGSMYENPNIPIDSMDWFQNLYFEGELIEDYIMSIDYAKEGILKFLSEDKIDNDSMFFVGFSDFVDEIKPLTNDYSAIEKLVSRTEPNGSTAFFDALYTSIDSLKTHNSKPIVIGLTDGGDNASSHTYQEVIDYANESGVRIYIIGLGYVQEDVLQEIASQTEGLYYYTTDPSKLNKIYKNIKRQIKSIYELDYLSNTDNSTDEERLIEFYFKNDTLTFANDTSIFELPQEVLTLLESRQQEIKEIAEQKKLDEEYNEQLKIYLGGGTGILLFGIGGFVFVSSRKKKNKLEIIKVYPNPTTGPITIDYIASDSHTNLKIIISTMNGMQITSKPVDSGEGSISLSFSKLKKGIYIVQVSSDSKSSKGMKILKK